MLNASPANQSAISGLTNDGTPQRGAPQPNPPGVAPSSAPVDGLVAAVNRFGDVKDPDQILRELQPQFNIFQKQNEAKRTVAASAFMQKVLGSAQLTPFVGSRGGFLRIVHSAQKFGGDVVDVTPFDGKTIGFMGDRKNHRDPLAVVLDDGLFQWGEAEVVTVHAAAHPNDQPPNFNNTAQNDDSTTTPTHTTVREKDKLTPMQKAALQGFCHVMRATDLPEIWKELEKCTTAEEMRKAINKAMEKSTQAHEGRVRGNDRLQIRRATVERVETGNICTGRKVSVLGVSHEGYVYSGLHDSFNKGQDADG